MFTSQITWPPLGVATELKSTPSQTAYGDNMSVKSSSSGWLQGSVTFEMKLVLYDSPQNTPCSRVGVE